jgi:hypothetical protein
MLFMLAISGGLYLIGEKGSTVNTTIELAERANLDFKSENLDEDVRALLASNDIDLDFEYIKNRGNLIQTRPTSRTHLVFSKKEDLLTLVKKEPNFQSSMIELHKGHGPKLFRSYQIVVAVSLMLTLLTGIWMGLASRAMRKKTSIALVIGSVVFLLLALG